MEPPAPHAPCPRCDGLPDDVTVNTGRDHRFDDAFYTLESLGDSFQERFRRCAACRTFFHWIDLPQTYGSGNCDEERCVRLSPAVSARLDRLFPADPKHPGDLGDVDDYFATVPLHLLQVALETHVFTGRPVVAPFVPRLCAILRQKGGHSLADLLSNYCYGRPDEAAVVLAGLEPEEGAELPYAARLLRERCLERVAKRC